jgi:spore germination protein (amino acid permease)
MVAIGVLSLPNVVVKYAKQDGWISAFLGVIYPVYIAIMAGFIQKKYPNENILSINKKCFGKIIGTLLNMFFALFFLLYLTSEVSGISNLIRLVIVSFLSPIKVYIVITFLGAYTVSKGLRIIGRSNETIFYLILFMCILLVVGIINGKLLNIRPIFHSGVINIIKSSKDSIYQYAGMEMYLLIYPYVSGKKDTKALAIRAAFIVALIYTWITFVTIFNLGIDIIPKFPISVPAVAKYITIPVLNNFRFIFMVLWSLIVINIVANYYYAVVISLNSVFKKANKNLITILIFPVVIFLTSLYKNSIIRANFLDFIVPKVTVAMIIYILIAVLLIYIRKGDILE